MTSTYPAVEPVEGASGTAHSWPSAAPANLNRKVPCEITVYANGNNSSGGNRCRTRGIAGGVSASSRTAPRSGENETACQTHSRTTLISSYHTKTIASVTERITEPQICSKNRVDQSATPQQEGECDLKALIGYRSSPSEMYARAWTQDCVDADTCQQFTDLQQKEDTPEQGSWETVKTSGTTTGCVEADYAWVDGTCFSEPTIVFSYRSYGHYTILWDDGEISQPDLPSDSIGGYRLACG